MNKLTGNIELIPHVALSPNVLRTELGVGRLESFAEVRLEGIYPIVKGWWVIPIRGIHDERIYHQLIEDVSDGILKDEIDAELLLFCLNGGVSLLHEGKVIYEAQCCSDLNNVDDWIEATAYRGKHWHTLWNGHPWRNFYYFDGDFHFSDYSEGTSTGETVEFSIPVAKLSETVRKAKHEVEQFRTRIYPYWQQHEDDF